MEFIVPWSALYYTGWFLFTIVMVHFIFKLIYNIRKDAKNELKLNKKQLKSSLRFIKKCTKSTQTNLVWVTDDQSQEYNKPVENFYIKQQQQQRKCENNKRIPIGKRFEESMKEKSRRAEIIARNRPIRCATLPDNYFQETKSDKDSDNESIELNSSDTVPLSEDENISLKTTRARKLVRSLTEKFEKGSNKMKIHMRNEKNLKLNGLRPVGPIPNISIQLLNGNEMTNRSSDEKSTTVSEYDDDEIILDDLNEMDLIKTINKNDSNNNLHKNESDSIVDDIIDRLYESMSSSDDTLNKDKQQTDKLKPTSLSNRSISPDYLVKVNVQKSNSDGAIVGVDDTTTENKWTIASAASDEYLNEISGSNIVKDSLSPSVILRRNKMKKTGPIDSFDELIDQERFSMRLSQYSISELCGDIDSESGSKLDLTKMIE